MKVLIAEDNVITRSLLKELVLGVPGITEVLEAEDGAQAWEILDSKSGIQILISDIQMPNWDGMRLCNNVRADVRFRSLPIILVTSVRDRDTVVEAAGYGVMGYILKPFTAEQVLKKIERAKIAAEENRPTAILDAPEEVMKGLGIDRESFIRMTQELVVDVHQGTQDVLALIVKGRPEDAVTRLDNMASTSAILGARQLELAIRESMDWLEASGSLQDFDAIERCVGTLKEELRKL